MISAAPFRDRVVHHALCQVIEPIFDRTLIFDTYANRRGMGTHAAIRRCQQFVRKYSYVLKADIRKYFPSIDHAILKQLIVRKIKCKRTLELIELIIDHSNPQEAVPDYYASDNLFSIIERRRGLPMGNLTSQFFANLYLSPLDHFVQQQLEVGGYLRYVDDFLLFSHDKQQLHRSKKAIQHYLAKELRLSIHARKSQVFPVRVGVSFLGQRVFTNHRRLRRENVQRFRHRLNRRIDLYRRKKISPALFESQLNSWLGHAKQANTFRLRRQILVYLRRQGLTVAETDRFAWRLLEQSSNKLPGGHAQQQQSR